MKSLWFVSHSKFLKQSLTLFWWNYFLNSLNLLNKNLSCSTNNFLLNFIFVESLITQNLHHPNPLNAVSAVSPKNSFQMSNKLLSYPNLYIYPKASKFNIFPQLTVRYILNLFTITNQANSNHKFKPHSNYRLLYLYQNLNKEFIFAPKHFFRVWQNGYTFLYNVFYFNYLPLVFGSKFFKKEILAFNWYLNVVSLTSWRYSSFFFTFYVTIYTRKLNFFFKQLKHKKLNFALITDLEYHFKLLFYFKKNKWWTISLIPININPWSVSFALPIFKNDFYVQFFFIKFLLLIRKRSLFERYKFSCSIWYKVKNFTQLYN